MHKSPWQEHWSWVKRFCFRSSKIKWSLRWEVWWGGATKRHVERPTTICEVLICSEVCFTHPLLTSLCWRKSSLKGFEKWKQRRAKNKANWWIGIPSVAELLHNLLNNSYFSNKLHFGRRTHCQNISLVRKPPSTWMHYWTAALMHTSGKNLHHWSISREGFHQQNTSRCINLMTGVIQFGWWFSLIKERKKSKTYN